MTEIQRAQLRWILATVPAVVIAAVFFNRVLWVWGLGCFLSTPEGQAFPASYAAPGLREVPRVALNLFLPGGLAILFWPFCVRFLPLIERTRLSVFASAMALLFLSQLLVVAIGIGNVHFGFIRYQATFECVRFSLAGWLALGVFFGSPRVLFRSLRPGVFLRRQGS